MSKPAAPNAEQVTKDQSRERKKREPQYHPGSRMVYRSKTTSSKNYMVGQLEPKWQPGGLRKDSPGQNRGLYKWQVIPRHLQRHKNRLDITPKKVKHKKAKTKEFKRSITANDSRKNGAKLITTTNYYQPLGDRVYVDPSEMDQEQMDAAAAAKVRFEAIKNGTFQPPPHPTKPSPMNQATRLRCLRVKEEEEDEEQDQEEKEEEEEQQHQQQRK
jgi:hypothetical protein